MWTVGLLLQCLNLIHLLQTNKRALFRAVCCYTLPKYTLPQVLQDFFAKAPIRPIDLTAPLIYTPQQFFRGPEQCCGLIGTRCNIVPGGRSSIQSHRYTCTVGDWTCCPFIGGVVKSRNSSEFPPSGCVKQGRVQKTSHSLVLNASISKTVGDSPKLLLMTHMKVHMRFRLAPRSITLDDLKLL